MRKHLPIPHLDEDDIGRLWAKIDACSKTECWPWTGCKRGGYGRLRVGGRYGKLFVATRLVYWLVNKIDPGPLEVLHRCDNPSCCNPRHLWLGTDADNNVDKENKGRAAHPIGYKNGLAKLTEADIVPIRRSPLTNRDLAREYRVTDVAISAIRTGRTWQHVGGPIRESRRGRRQRVGCLGAARPRAATAYA